MTRPAPTLLRKRLRKSRDEADPFAMRRATKIAGAIGTTRTYRLVAGPLDGRTRAVPLAVDPPRVCFMDTARIGWYEAPSDEWIASGALLWTGGVD